MNKFWLGPLLALPLVALAADETKKDPPRTTRLGACSKEAHAKGLKGDARKKFISTCIAAGKQAKEKSDATEKPAPPPQPGS